MAASVEGSAGPDQTPGLVELGDRVVLLADQPGLGTVPPKLEELGIDRYLELAVGRNRVVYEVRDDTVFILIVTDHRREFRSVLGRRLVEPPIGEGRAGTDQ